MKECFEESVLQAFLDGELNSSDCAAVARHLGDCDDCAASLSVIEEETASVFAALDQELNTLVPTQRLWTRISETIEVENRSRGWFARLTAAIQGFSLLNPASLAAMCVLVIVGVVSTSVLLRRDAAPVQTASRAQTPRQSVEKDPVSTASLPVETTAPEDDDDSGPASSGYSRPRATAQRAVFAERTRPVRSQVPSAVTVTTPSRYLDGEESFVTTIERLERTANVNKDQVLRSSARFAFEKDMAVVDATIDRMKQEVRKNPANSDAKEILFASYRNKIELLRSVNERSELVASTR